MRRYCKGIDIANDAAAVTALLDFLDGKQGRRDVRRYLRRSGGIEAAAREVAREVRSGDFSAPPTRYFKRTEPTNGKERRIGCAHPKRQVYDHLAVRGLMPLFEAKIGHWQCASVPGRGQSHVRRGVRRWVREPRSKYFVKLDVRKCYPNIDRETLKALLARDVKNAPLLRLVFWLVDTGEGENGLPIGSYLSQWLANYYLSYAYHHACERLRKRRVNRRTRAVTERRLVSHVLFYMDDILLMGPSKRDLKMAVRMLAAYMRDALKLELKPWKVCRVGAEPVDMAGFRFQPWRTTVRKSIFRRAKRAFAKARRAARETGRVPVWRARRCCSYFGWLYHADCIGHRRLRDVDGTLRACKKSISDHEKRQRNADRLLAGAAG